MQKTRKLIVLYCSLLLYSGALFIFLILGTPVSLPLTLPFYLFVPGYAFIEVFLPKLHTLEKISISIGLSMALFVGIQGFIRAFRVMGLFSELAILTILSTICLVAKLAK